MELSGQLHDPVALAPGYLSNKRLGLDVWRKEKTSDLPEIEPLYSYLQSLFRVGYPHYDNEWHRTTHAHSASLSTIQIIVRYVYCDK
jgi:hypothetical protein